MVADLAEKLKYRIIALKNITFEGHDITWVDVDKAGAQVIQVRFVYRGVLRTNYIHRTYSAFGRNKEVFDINSSVVITNIITNCRKVDELLNNKIETWEIPVN